MNRFVGDGPPPRNSFAFPDMVISLIGGGDGDGEEPVKGVFRRELGSGPERYFFSFTGELEPTSNTDPSLNDEQRIIGRGPDFGNTFALGVDDASNRGGDGSGNGLGSGVAASPGTRLAELLTYCSLRGLNVDPTQRGREESTDFR